MRLGKVQIIGLLIGLAVLFFGYRMIFGGNKTLEPTDPLRTHQGAIIGGIDTDNPAINVYNGIPYATAARWKAPEDIAPWGAKAHDARSFGPQCMQPTGSGNSFAKAVLKGSGVGWWKRQLAAFAGSSSPETSEDCLFLNVRTGNISGPTLQPVMVWIHGGSHRFGSGSTSWYQANGLVEKGVVLVTINYRLGPFGYMAHPALTEEAGTSGNYGLLDQVAALKWVRNNIEQFGGDPNNVTVFGESAGGQSVTELMATPLADGLYHKAIMQSGVASYNTIHLQDSLFPGTQSAEDVGEEFVAGFVNTAATAAELRRISSEDLLQRMNVRPKLAEYFLPVVDGKVIPEPIGKTIRDNAHPAVPVLAGYNADEGTLFYNSVNAPLRGHGPFLGPLEERIGKLVDIVGKNEAMALAALYDLDDPDTWHDGATDMLGDDIFGVHTRFMGKANAKSGAPTWLYFFNRVPPNKNQTLGAYHASELPFVFGSQPPLLPTSENDAKLAETMGHYWTNFAKYADPNGDALPHWPPYEAGSDRWLQLGESVQAITLLRAQKLDILEKRLNRTIDRMERQRALSGLEIGTRNSGAVSSVGATNTTLINAAADPVLEDPAIEDIVPAVVEETLPADTIPSDILPEPVEPVLVAEPTETIPNTSFDPNVELAQGGEDDTLGLDTAAIAVEDIVPASFPDIAEEPVRDLNAAAQSGFLSPLPTPEAQIAEAAIANSELAEIAASPAPVPVYEELPAETLADEAPTPLAIEAPPVSSNPVDPFYNPGANSDNAAQPSIILENTVTPVEGTIEPVAQDTPLLPESTPEQAPLQSLSNDQ